MKIKLSLIACCVMILAACQADLENISEISKFRLLGVKAEFAKGKVARHLLGR